MRLPWSVFPWLMLTLLVGCANSRSTERFSNVQESISQRLGQRIVWERDSAAGESIRTEVSRLLTQPLTADSAVQIALLNSNSLQATYEDLGVAQADLVQAGLLRNPSFGGFLRYLDRSPRDPNWNLGFDFPLLDPFLIPLRKKLAGAALEEAEARVTTAVLKQAAETRAAFYTLQADQRVIEAQRSVADLAEVAAEFAERQYKAGNIDDLALAQQRAARQQARIALLQSENAADVVRQRLRRLLGLWGVSGQWTVEAQSSPPAAPVANESALVEMAVSSRPDVIASRKDVERQQYALDVNRKWWLESVQVGVETERASGGGYQTGPHFSFDVPIFDQKQAAVARQEALVRQSRYRLRDVEDQVRQEVYTAVARMNSAARTAMLYNDDVLPLRRQMSGMTEKRYQGMLIGVFELLTAKSEEIQAVTAAARATQEYWIARSDLELAIGRRLPMPSPTTQRSSQTQPATRPTPAMPGTRSVSEADPHAGHGSQGATAKENPKSEHQHPK